MTNDNSLPSDIVKILIYKNRLPSQQLEECVELNEGEAAFVMDSPEHMTQLEELITNLTAAQVPFSLDDDENTGEIVLSWAKPYTDKVEQTMQALGIDVYDDEDATPESGIDYKPSQHKPGTTYKAESITETAIMKPQGEIPVKKPIKGRRKGDMLAKLSTMTQKSHGRGQPPLSPLMPPIPATEAIDRVLSGEDVEHIVSTMLGEVSKKELIARFRGKMAKPYPKDKDGDGKVNE